MGVLLSSYLYYSKSRKCCFHLISSRVCHSRILICNRHNVHTKFRQDRYLIQILGEHTDNMVIPRFMPPFLVERENPDKNVE
jgi:hypothetical protein